MEENKKSPQVVGTTSEENWLYRRFEVINEEDLTEAEKIIVNKQLSRYDLLVLLKTYRIRNI